MIEYPIHLEEDDNDALLVTSPDFPELTTFGEDRDETCTRAVDAMREAIAARMYYREDIPHPSDAPSTERVVLPTLTAVKVILYQDMREQGIGKAELARRLGWHLPQVDRVLEINHKSRLDRLDAALNAIGRQLQVTAAAR